MFKGNEHLTPDTFDNLTENIGGENNAYTAEDVTVYHEVVPSNYLNPILWAEAERMSSLAFNDKNFTSERDVVKEEYRQRILRQSLRRILSRHRSRNHSRFILTNGPGIGNIAELDASKLPEVRRFIPPFIGPDNATLIVVGDFKPEELDGWIKKYFGAVKKPSEKIPRVTAKEPPRKEDGRRDNYSAKAPLPAMAVTYLAPSIRSRRFVGAVTGRRNSGRRRFFPTIRGAGLRAAGRAKRFVRCRFEGGPWAARFSGSFWRAEKRSKKRKNP